MVTGEYYANSMLRGHYLPGIAVASRSKRFAPRQDQARPRVAQETIKWLDCRMRHHRSMQCSGKWADFRPLDYGVWNQVQGNVWTDKTKSLSDPRASPLKTLTAYPGEAVDNAIRPLQERLQELVAERGGYFEYKLEKGEEEKREAKGAVRA